MKKTKQEQQTIIVGNLSGDYIVQKSEPLMLMRTVPFELGELKVLDTYLSRINSHDESKRTVVFTKNEYEQLMGLTESRPQTLKKCIKSMLQKVVEVPSEQGYEMYSLFNFAKCEKNEYDQWIVTLTCSEEARKLFFNIEKLGYLKYALKNILSLTSKYSFLLYLYLCRECYRGNWTIPLDELREQVLDIKNSEYYSEYKRFNDDILKRALNEINDKTNLTFEYSAQRTGRHVSDICFKLISKTDYIGDAPLTNAIESADETEEEKRDTICLGFSNSEFEPFSREELMLLKDMAWSKKSKSEVEHFKQNVDMEYACQYAVANYLRRQIQSAKLNNPKNLFRYVKKMIENDTASELQ